ncbi:hypothetical protein T11_7724 [Trichinella zimbabwensis]|uniref:Uncharacterized protein n=1 Tax=Trichinella zimbabwensis TaxID=268475 RepID=A0A0V1I1X8_9BILA|nr:hypothetical protein T11_7724 [Trichinella zimbabwensis]
MNNIVKQEAEMSQQKSFSKHKNFDISIGTLRTQKLKKHYFATGEKHYLLPDCLYHFWQFYPSRKVPTG